MVSTFHKDHPEKLTATLVPLDSAPPMARVTVKPTDPLKRKQGQSIGRSKKHTKWGDKQEATKKKRQGIGDKEEATKKNPYQCGSKARSREEAGDLFTWP